MAIQTYVYVAALSLSPVAQERVRFTYRRTESVADPRELRHPVTREALLERNSRRRLNLATMSDVPGGTGLGSSSSFTVALLKALDALDGVERADDAVAEHAILLEREKLGEPGGWQDQVQAAVGGFRLYSFHGASFSYGSAYTSPWWPQLQESLVLVHAGSAPRNSGRHQIGLRKNIITGSAREHLRAAADLAVSGHRELCNARTIDDAHGILVEVLTQAWREKRMTVGQVQSPTLEALQEGFRHGALSGKLCGAGGRGFLLFITRIGERQRFIDSWPEVHCIPVQCSQSGGRVILQEPQSTPSHA